MEVLNWTYAIIDFLGGSKGVTGEFRYFSKMNVLDYANEYLFTPLNIQKRENTNCNTKEEHFAYIMNKGPHGQVWLIISTGMPTAGWGLSLSAYEMAQEDNYVLMMAYIIINVLLVNPGLKR